MKKVLSFLLLGSWLCANSQNLTKNKDCMWQLPRTTEDFQKYQFDYNLESAIDIGAYYDFHSNIIIFNSVGICMLEHNTPVDSIHCEIQKVTDDGSTIRFYEENAAFKSDGTLSNYNGKIAVNQRYRFGIEQWYQKDWVPLSPLTPCIPNSYKGNIIPTRDSKGLIRKIGNEIEYFYDALERVIEVRVHNNEFVGKYEYVDKSNKIKKIEIYVDNEKQGDIHYGWTGQKLYSVDCENYTPGTRGKYSKKYQYDNHNHVSRIDFKGICYGEIKEESYTFENKYNEKGRIVFSKVGHMLTHSAESGRPRNGSFKSPMYHTRTYSYDNKGNWIKIEEHDMSGGASSTLVREIKYAKDVDAPKNLKMAEQSSTEEEIYEDVEQSPSFPGGEKAQTDWIEQNLQYPIYAKTNGIQGRVWVQVVVNKDGSISDPNVLFAVDSSLEQEALRLVQTMPKWNPGKQHDEAVRVRLTVPITFKLR